MKWTGGRVEEEGPDAVLTRGLWQAQKFRVENQRLLGDSVGKRLASRELGSKPAEPAVVGLASPTLQNLARAKELGRPSGGLGAVEPQDHLRVALAQKLVGNITSVGLAHARDVLEAETHRHALASALSEKPGKHIELSGFAHFIQEKPRARGIMCSLDNLTLCQGKFGEPPKEKAVHGVDGRPVLLVVAEDQNRLGGKPIGQAERVISPVPASGENLVGAGKG